MIVYGIIQQYGIEGLTVATIMAGVFLILLGLFRLGTIIKFIPTRSSSVSPAVSP